MSRATSSTEQAASTYATLLLMRGVVTESGRDLICVSCLSFVKNAIQLSTISAFVAPTKEAPLDSSLTTWINDNKEKCTDYAANAFREGYKILRVINKIYINEETPLPNIEDDSVMWVYVLNPEIQRAKTLAPIPFHELLLHHAKPVRYSALREHLHKFKPSQKFDHDTVVKGMRELFTSIKEMVDQSTAERHVLSPTLKAAYEAFIQHFQTEPDLQLLLIAIGTHVSITGDLGYFIETLALLCRYYNSVNRQKLSAIQNTIQSIIADPELMPSMDAMELRPLRIEDYLRHHHFDNPWVVQYFNWRYLQFFDSGLEKVYWPYGRSDHHDLASKKTLCIFFAGTGNSSTHEHPCFPSYLLSSPNSKDVLYVKGCEHPAVCGDLVTPDLKGLIYRLASALCRGDTIGTPGELVSRLEAQDISCVVGTQDCYEFSGYNEPHAALFERSTPDDTEYEQLIFTGYSRGAVTTFMLAREFHELGVKLPIYIYAYEPVPGNLIPGPQLHFASDLSDCNNIKRVELVVAPYLKQLPHRGLLYNYLHRSFYSILSPWMHPDTQLHLGIQWKIDHNSFPLSPSELRDLKAEALMPLFGSIPRELLHYYFTSHSAPEPSVHQETSPGQRNRLVEQIMQRRRAAPNDVDLASVEFELRARSTITPEEASAYCSRLNLNPRLLEQSENPPVRISASSTSARTLTHSRWTWQRILYFSINAIFLLMGATLFYTALSLPIGWLALGLIITGGILFVSGTQHCIYQLFSQPHYVANHHDKETTVNAQTTTPSATTPLAR